MYAGRPLSCLALLRCPEDAGPLAAADDAPAPDGRMRNGTVRCAACGRQFPVRDGVLSLLDEDALDAESAHERRKRDEEAGYYEEQFVGEPLSAAMELEPMFDAMRPWRAGVLFELGCGTGRYTIELARTCATLVAVDFSAESLRLLARKLPDGAPVALVHADVTRLHFAERAFDGGLSTLVSNLPRPGHRAAMYQLAAESLRPEGGFVFGTHFYGLPQRLRGMQREGYYSEGGIFRRMFDQREIAQELRPFFRRERVVPVQVPVPLGRRLGLPVVKLSRLLGHVPVVNQFGQLLMVAATGPIPAATRTFGMATMDPARRERTSLSM